MIATRPLPPKAAHSAITKREREGDRPRLAACVRVFQRRQRQVKPRSQFAAKVECATCHGNVAAQTVAQRNVDHTMGFCVNCHNERKAPVDCLTCHF